MRNIKNRTPLQTCRCKTPIPARQVDDSAIYEGGFNETESPMQDNHSD